MKRLVLLMAVLAAPASLFADTATHRYLVSTRHASHGTFTKDPVDTPRGENIRVFANFDTYAADLTAAEVAELRSSPSVREIEPVRERHAFDLDQSLTAGVQTRQYGIDLVRAPEAWPVVTGKNINVVVIDTGLDYRHPELKGIYAGGFNTFNDSNDPMDDNGHGTHCAGIVAAANNTEGVVGVAPDVKLWSVKVLDSTGSGDTENVIRALDWVLTQKAARGGNWIVSLSLGSDQGSSVERNAFAHAIEGGLLAVAASGNESTSTNIAPVAFPAAYPGMISVGAIDAQRRIASFSNQGVELSVVAPGVSVISTLPVGTHSVTTVTTSKGTIQSAAMTGSKTGSVTAQYVYCNIGRPEDFPASVAGKIALIKRGDLTFGEKAKNAMNAGASAIVIFNKDTSALNFTLIGADCDATGNNCVNKPEDVVFGWPLVVAIGQADGETLAATPTGGTLTVSAVADDYGSKSGTSMATPHVAGVAALVWSAAPSATREAVKNAIEQTAADLGNAGRDVTFGFGLVDALSAAKQLSPQSFGVGGSPEPPANVPTKGGRTILRRGSH